MIGQVSGGRAAITVPGMTLRTETDRGGGRADDMNQFDGISACPVRMYSDLRRRNERRVFLAAMVNDARRARVDHDSTTTVAAKSS